MCGRPHRLFGLVVPGGRVVAVVAARQERSPVFRRRTLVRGYRGRLTTVSGPVFAVLLSILLAGACGLATAPTASAQGFTYNPRPPRPVTARPANDGQMLV